MAKDWNVRLSETIAFIKKTPAPGFTGDRQFVTAALDDWNQSAPADQRKQLSELMSQEKATNRPASKPDRAYRRAAILLKCAIIDPNQATWAGESSATDSKTRAANSAPSTAWIARTIARAAPWG